MHLSVGFNSDFFQRILLPLSFFGPKQRLQSLSMSPILSFPRGNHLKPLEWADYKALHRWHRRQVLISLNSMTEFIRVLVLDPFKLTHALEACLQFNGSSWVSDWAKWKSWPCKFTQKSNKNGFPIKNRCIIWVSARKLLPQAFCRLEWASLFRWAFNRCITLHLGQCF